MVFNNNLLLGAAGAAGGYTIDQSIRFNDDDSAYLYRTPSSAGNRKTWTFSSWVKRANLFNSSVPQIIFSAANGSTLDFIMQFGQSDDTLRISDYSSGSASNLITTQLFRDPSAWYHFVLQYDTTQATSSDRMKLYVNGTQVTAFGTASYPSLNYDSAVNNNLAHNISRGAYSANGYFDGYQAEINFIDGTALDASSFGQTDAVTGQWVPIAYTGSYGTNGFYITGEDSADLGADYSGNGNDFASSGLTSADQMLDTPTNNFWTLTPLDSNSTLANGNLQNKGGNSTNTHAPAFPTTGKWYVEIDCIDINTGTAGAHFFGICDASVNYNQSFSDHAAISAGQQRGGQLTKNNSNTTTGTAVNDGDIIALAFDADNLTLDLYVNNVQSGSQITGLTDVQYKLWIQDGSTVTNMQVNFGQTGGFTYTPPTGFNALSTANLSDPTIADPTAYFQPTLYTGTGSSLAVTQSGNSTFQPDFVWIKGRSGATEHVLTDAVRGVTKELSSNDTGAEETVAQGLTAFGSSGFTVGTDGSYNTSSATYVGWQWQANGSGSSNSDGSITSTVSANTTAGFSIVKYTGTGVNATVGHGLGVAPKMVIVKPRDGTTANGWRMYWEKLGATQYILLNSSAVAASYSDWNSTAPTSSVFSVGAGSPQTTVELNTNYIAYCFAEVEGFSKFTSYEGNASTDGPFIYCGFKPSFVMIKNADAAEDWWIQDAAREPFNGGNMARIAPNSSAAEADNVAWFDFVSNGLKVRYNAGGINSSGTHIVAAFAESPFKTANAR